MFGRTKPDHRDEIHGLMAKNNALERAITLRDKWCKSKDARLEKLIGLAESSKETGKLARGLVELLKQRKVLVNVKTAGLDTEWFRVNLP